MTTIFLLNSRLSIRWRLFFFFLLGAWGGSIPDVFAHQTPSTIILLDVSPTNVAVELQLPLGELELAFGHDVYKNPTNLVTRVGPQLKEYLLAHIHPMAAKDQPWLVTITDMHLEAAEQTYSGPYQEITVHLIMTPPPGASTRKFILDYDVIMHQLVTHSALVSIRNDWERGQTGDQLVEVGVIRVDTKTTLIYPLTINLEAGSVWQGFWGMVSLGIEHIAEGTDHLLFLLVLLLPAPLLVTGGQGRRLGWGKFGGIRYGLNRLLTIVTAFTIGHSITLILGSLGWVRILSQPIEVLIAVSILVSAIHAIRPLFPGREAWIATGFGLIHGMAFAGTLENLQLDIGPMALSILGFNLGIELIQLFVIILTIPWLMLLSRTPAYTYVRVGGALLASIAALAWIAERVTGRANAITHLLESQHTNAIWLLIILAGFAVWNYWQTRASAPSNTRAR